MAQAVRGEVDAGHLSGGLPVRAPAPVQQRLSDLVGEQLAEILEAFVAKELQPYLTTFPPEFYKEMFRLKDLPYRADSVKRLFQRLTENVGYPKLREHLGSVVTLMKLSKDWDDFKGKLELIHPVPDGQEMLDISFDHSNSRPRKG